MAVAGIAEAEIRENVRWLDAVIRPGVQGGKEKTIGNRIKAAINEILRDDTDSDAMSAAEMNAFLQGTVINDLVAMLRSHDECSKD